MFFAPILSFFYLYNIRIVFKSRSVSKTCSPR